MTSIPTLQSQRVLEALSALGESFAAITSRPDAHEISRVFADTLVARLGAAGAQVFLVEPETHALHLEASAGVHGGEEALDELPVYHVVETRRAFWSNEVEIARPAWFERERIERVGILPLAYADRTLGALVYFAREPVERDLEVLVHALSRYAAIAIHDASEQASSRRQIEALARESWARSGEFEAIVSNMPDAVLVARDGKISFANKTALRMFGFAALDDVLVPVATFTERVNERMADGMPVPREDTVLARVLRGENVTAREERITQWRTGRDIWVQISGVPLRARGGEVQGGVVVATEITRLKQLEQSKDEWLAIAAHELRTPLTPITVHLQMAQRRLHMGRPVDPDVFDKALEQVKRLSRLVNGLLDVTRLQAGQLEMLVEDVDLRDLAEAVVARTRPSAPNHRFVLDLAPEPVRVQGDRARLDEIIVVLVDNAVKYSPNGGEVWVSVRPRDDQAVLAVRDQGIGIGAEERTQMFERYFRAESVPHTQYGGLGLGLWIANKVVQKHGGHIELESTLGVGSTFRVVLPRGATATAQPAATQAASKRGRLLVVDDDGAVLEAVEQMLEEDGFDVQSARSGPEALEKARHALPDAMLLDLRMPGMDGWEVHRRLMSDPRLASIPVVLVSADRDARLRASSMGVQGFVQKPFDLDELERVLDQIVHRA